MSIMRASLGAGLLATGLLLAGCGGNSAPTPSPMSAGSEPSSSSSTPSSSDQAAGSGSSGSGSSGSGSSGSGSSGSGSSGGGSQGGGRCTLSSLTASLGRTTGEAGQRHTVVVWKNTSSTACTMTGFGGVDLRGPNDPQFGGTYSLPRSSKKATAVRLPPGGTAHTLITWLPPQDGPGWTPTNIVITPPDETSSATVKWPGGAVLRQDAATHPGTFIDPVAAGSQG
jgi:hypothetical protein